MDINAVREGAVLICLVKIDGGGVYVGDLHANQGDSELSLHTTDVSSYTELEVEVIKDLDIDGPLLLPNAEDLPYINAPYTDAERETGRALAEEYGVEMLDEMDPIQVIGSGETVVSNSEHLESSLDELLGLDRLPDRCSVVGDPVDAALLAILYDKQFGEVMVAQFGRCP